MGKVFFPQQTLASPLLRKTTVCVMISSCWTITLTTTFLSNKRQRFQRCWCPTVITGISVPQIHYSVAVNLIKYWTCTDGVLDLLWERCIRRICSNNRCTWLFACEPTAPGFVFSIDSKERDSLWMARTHRIPYCTFECTFTRLFHVYLFGAIHSMKLKGTCYFTGLLVEAS